MRLNLILLCTCLLAASGASAQSVTPERWLLSEFKLFRVYPRLDRAERFYRQARYAEARVLLAQVLVIDPSNLQALQLIIETCQQQRDFACVDSRSVQALDLPLGRAHGAYYLMLEAIRQERRVDVIKWGEIALSDIHDHVEFEERALALSAVNEAYSAIRREIAAQEFDENSLVSEGSDPIATQQTLTGQELSQLVAEKERQDRLRQLVLNDATAIASLTLDENLYLANVFEQEGELELALTLTSHLPEQSAARNLQVDLLSKLNNHAAAAELYERTASEQEKRSPEYWRRMYDLLGAAGLRQQQLGLIIQAQEEILSSPAFLQIALAFLEDEELRDRLRSDVEIDSPEYELRRDELQNVLSILQTSVASNANSDNRYRADAEIMLAGNFLARGDEDSAWQLIRTLITEDTLSFDQLKSLQPIVWGLNGCDDVIALLGSMVGELDPGDRLILISCYRRLDRQLDAYMEIDTLLALEDVPLEVREELIRTQGYLAMDLSRPDLAIEHWKTLLTDTQDSQLALSTSYAAFMLEDWNEVETFLRRVEPAQLLPASVGLYWQLSALLAANNQDYEAARSDYQNALVWDPGNLDMRTQLAALAEKNEDLSTASSTWADLMHVAPATTTLHGEYAYYLSRIGDTQPAVVEFTKAVEINPDATNLRRDLVYAQLRLLQHDKAEANLEYLIENKTRLATTDEQHYNDQGLLTDVSREWSFELSDVMRLNENSTGANNPVIRNSSYQGYGSLVANYMPTFGRNENNNQRYMFTGRFFWANPDQSLTPENESSVLAIGTRFRLSDRYAIFGSVERLFGIGKQASDDTLLRVSGSLFTGLGWPFAEKGWNYRNLYLDAAYFVESEAEYATVEYEHGHVFRMGSATSNWGLLPFLRLGATVNNDNAGGRHESRVDAGFGISLVSRHLEDDYRGKRLSNRISLVFSSKIAGNTKDKYAAHLRFNLRL